jgi:hypothetical protein
MLSVIDLGFRRKGPRRHRGPFSWKGLSLLRADLGRLHTGFGFSLGFVNAVVDDGGGRGGGLGLDHGALLRGAVANDVEFRR